MTNCGAKSPCAASEREDRDRPVVQRILVFQQHGSGEKKIKGIREHGRSVVLDTRSIDEPLPAILDDDTEHLPQELDTDLVLDFLRHPDLSQDLARLCEHLGVPVVATGKKWRGERVFTPPT